MLMVFLVSASSFSQLKTANFWREHDEYASSAGMALRMLRTAEAAGMPYRLAILDMQMPGMDGLELARIMQSDPTLLQTRKIILTSLGLRLESRIMEEAGSPHVC